ncbi:hypothetical protein GCM10027343_01570 [Noviherbaspirillum agri]
MSGWASWKISEKIESEARSAFMLRAYELQSSLAMQFQRYEDLLFGAAGLYRADHAVSRAEFAAYAAALNIGARFRALSSFNYAEYFDRSQREQFARAFPGSVGSVESASLKLASDRDEHMVITRTFPDDAPGLGYDLMNNGHRLGKHVSFQLSGSLYRRNIPVSSGLPLLAPGATRPALALRLGVFTLNGTDIPRLVGTVGLAFRIADFFQEAAPAFADGRLFYRVENIGRVDGTAYNPPVEIYTNAGQQHLTGTPGDLYKTSFIQPFGGALLRVELIKDQASLVGNRVTTLPFFVFATGLLFFGLIATIVRVLVHRKFELAAAVNKKTMELEKEILRAKQLERELANSVEEERRRIGHELHDEIGQRLTGLSLSFKALSEKLRPTSHELSAHAANLEENTRETIASVRALTHGLVPVPQEPDGLRIALEQLATAASTPATQCTFDFDDPVDIDDANVAANLYRIAQEATNNALKHAKATQVTIRLDEVDGKVTLSITDNGVGFERDSHGVMWRNSTAGAGLRIMRHRASVINYTLHVDSCLDRGTTIRVQEC